MSEFLKRNTPRLRRHIFKRLKEESVYGNPQLYSYSYKGFKATPQFKVVLDGIKGKNLKINFYLKYPEDILGSDEKILACCQPRTIRLVGIGEVLYTYKIYVPHRRYFESEECFLLTCLHEIFHKIVNTTPLYKNRKWPFRNIKSEERAVEMAAFLILYHVYDYNSDWMFYYCGHYLRWQGLSNIRQFNKTFSIAVGLAQIYMGTAYYV